MLKTALKITGRTVVTLITALALLTLIVPAITAYALPVVQKTSTLYYTTNGAAVGCDYDDTNKLWINFAPCGPNSLTQIAGLYKLPKAVQNTAGQTYWMASSTDWVGPWSMVNNSSNSASFVGGWHKAADGTSSTARMASWKVLLDGVEKTGVYGTYTGSVIDIFVTNYIYAWDKIGTDSLKETVHYTIYDNCVDVEVIGEAVTPVTIKEYYGLQTDQKAWPHTPSFNNGRQGYLTGAPSGSNVRYFINNSGSGSLWPNVDGWTATSDYGDRITTWLDRSYSLGTLANKAEAQPCSFSTMYLKTYMNLIKSRSVTLSPAQSVGWRGGYRFTKDMPSVTVSQISPFSEAEGLLFDDFSSVPSVENWTVPTHVTLTRSGGLLKMVKQQSGVNEFTAKTNISTAAAQSKFVIEYWLSQKADNACHRVNINGGNVFYTENNAATSGTHYIVYDRAAGTAEYYYPGGTAPVCSTGIPAATQSSFELAITTSLDTIGKSDDYDYLAVYEDKPAFTAMLQNVTATGAVLITNAPVDVNLSSLKIGGEAVTVSKASGAYNTYVLTFRSKLADETDYTLDGVFKRIADADTVIGGSLAFTTPKWVMPPYAPARELFFDDFKSSPQTEPFYSITPKNPVDGTPNPVLRRENGRMNIYASHGAWDAPYVYLNVDSVLATTADTVILEFQVPAGEKKTRIRLDNSTLSGYHKAYGVYYAVYDRVKHEYTVYAPDGTTSTQGGLTNAAGNKVKVAIGFEYVAPSLGQFVSYDYFALYEAPRDFTFAAQGVAGRQNEILVQTNVPINLSGISFAVDGGAGAVTAITKNPDSYNTYTLTLSTPLTPGAHSLSLANVKRVDGNVLLKSTAPQTVSFSVEFNCHVASLNIMQNGSQVTGGVLSGQPVMAKAVLNNRSAQPETCTIVTAVYEKSASGVLTLVRIVTDPVTIPGGAQDYTPQTRPLSLDGLNLQKTVVRAFVWSGTDTMCPMTSAVSAGAGL